MSVYSHFEIYPTVEKGSEWNSLYFIEFTRWTSESKMYWRLFKRCFLYTEKEWKKKVTECPNDFAVTLMGPEGHPYQLSNGEVEEHPGVIQMDTMEFLKFMVDAMNEKALREKSQDPA